MAEKSSSIFATAIVLWTGALWGLYWLPVRRLSTLALPGAWGTLAIVAAAMLLMAPIAFWRRRNISTADPAAILSVAIGGAAFMLYSVGFAYGRVAIVILLFFLTPVWSTLIGRYIMGWYTPRLRLAAIAAGLAGLFIMLGAGGRIPIPSGTGEWLALVSGMLWSVATTGIRSRSDLGAPESAFIFSFGAFSTALILAPLLAPFPTNIAVQSIVPILGWMLAAGGIWWALSMAGLMWAAPRLVPARVGILLMTEVIFGTVSAALIAQEQIGRAEFIGGCLVLTAGVLEVWPVKKRARSA